MKTEKSISTAALVAPLLVAATIFPWTTVAEAATSGTAAKLMKVDDLRSSPEMASQIVTTLKLGTEVKMLERKGFWQKVETPQGAGWLKLSSLKLATGESATAGLAAITTGRGATGNLVSTSGTRGLSAEEMLAAQPDEKTYEAVQARPITLKDAEIFAAAGKLEPRTVEYVTPPKPAKTNSKKK